MSINRGIDKDVMFVHTHTHTHTHTPNTMEYYSAIKKNEIMAFSATWTVLEIIIVSLTKTDKYHITSHIYGI